MLSSKIKLLFVLVSILVFGVSCSSNRSLTYFKNIPDTVSSGSTNSPLTLYSDPLVRPNDILHISVQTLDPHSTNVMGVSNASTFSTQASTGQTNVTGYLVDKNGMIEMPLVGKISVAGLSTAAVREAIREKAGTYYKDPVVNVRFANFEITVLGEVSRPARYIVPNEKVTLLDALGMAGDLTIYGKRENVLVIREENGEKKFARFNLTSTNIFQEPYFYLKQGDVVYVEASKAKLATSEAARSRTYTVLISGISLLVVILTRVNNW